MTNSKVYSCVSAMALIFALQVVLADPQGRIIDGNAVDTLRRFPHHVTIFNDEPKGRQYCSGSIIADRWILTSALCVSNANFTIHFQMKDFDNSKNSFSISLDENAVIPYPTGYDNIALVQLPVTLRFSEKLAPIDYSRNGPQLYNGQNNGFVVMPGLSSNPGKELAYGMFRLISPTECKVKYGKSYDEYLQICTLGWNNNKQVPCEGNEGGGLVIGWPRQPRLIGIFTSSSNCVSGVPAIYVNLAKYERWINETIN